MAASKLICAVNFLNLPVPGTFSCLKPKLMPLLARSTVCASAAAGQSVNAAANQPALRGAESEAANEDKEKVDEVMMGLNKIGRKRFADAGDRCGVADADDVSATAFCRATCGA